MATIFWGFVIDIRHRWELFRAAPEFTSPAIRPQRTGWTPLPDAIQLRRRADDARPWEDVR